MMETVLSLIVLGTAQGGVYPGLQLGHRVAGQPKRCRAAEPAGILERPRVHPGLHPRGKFGKEARSHCPNNYNLKCSLKSMAWGPFFYCIHMQYN